MQFRPHSRRATLARQRPSTKYQPLSHRHPSKTSQQLSARFRVCRQLLHHQQPRSPGRRAADQVQGEPENGGASINSGNGNTFDPRSHSSRSSKHREYIVRRIVRSLAVAAVSYRPWDPKVSREGGHWALRRMKSRQALL